MERVLAYGFPQEHPLLVGLMPLAEVLRHNLPDCALAAAVTQSAVGAVLHAADAQTNLAALAERWHLHPTVRTRPILLVGEGAWVADEAMLGTLLPADAYLPGTCTADTVYGTLSVLSKRFSKLLDAASHSEDILPSLNVKLEKLLREHSMLSEISVERLAHQAGMSQSRFQRTVKRLTGRSPVEYINYLRLQRARQMLATRQGSVSDIAYQTGYNSVAYFCKMFKKEYGVTPGQVLGG